MISMPYKLIHMDASASITIASGFVTASKIEPKLKRIDDYSLEFLCRMTITSRESCVM